MVELTELTVLRTLGGDHTTGHVGVGVRLRSIRMVVDPDPTLPAVFFREVRGRSVLGESPTGSMSRATRRDLDPSGDLIFDR